MALTVLLPENPYSRELLALLRPLLPPDSRIRDPDAGLEGLAGQRLLFALALDESGCSESGYRMLMTLRRSRTLLEGCVAGLVVTGRGELYTKDAARDLVFAANQAGCAFLGRPLVEATGSLRNFRVQAQIGGTDEETAFRAAVSELLERLTAWEGPAPVGRVLALHASQRSTSNTLALWEMVRRSLPPEVQVQEYLPAERDHGRLQRMQLHRLYALRGAGRVLLWRADGGGGVSGGALLRHAGDGLRQLQRCPLRQSHRLRQPSDGAVPPDPVL